MNMHRMSIKDVVNPFSTQAVCAVLVKQGLITENQSKAILRKEYSFREKIERIRTFRRHSETSGAAATNSVSVIDVIDSLHLKRADDQARHLDEEMIYKALADEWNIPFQKIDPLKLDLNVVTTTIPRSFAMKHLILPVGISDGCLTIATADPFNREALEDVARASQLKVQVVVSPKTDIVKLIDEFFGFKCSIVAAESQFSTPEIDLGNLEQYVRLKSSEELSLNDQHIVKAVNHLFSYAFDQRASDIHIEPKRDASLIRMRIDGVLHTVYKIPKNVHSAVVSRIKNLSRLNMAEKRRPQDGRIKTDKGGSEAEVRVSTVPVAFGEKVVMRIMEPDILFQDLQQLGFTGTDLEKYHKMIQRPYGMVLVCGPTGSGKSTTLYSSLRYLSTPEINITTVEDPIEMVFEDFNQIAVQSAVGINFANILRNILRQDPDIIMIGEMRDLETTQNAIQSALTGHLVLSTLHTNDSTSAITRLLDLGIPSFLIQSTLIGVVAQRLVRKVCSYCKSQIDVAASTLRAKGLEIRQEGSISLYHGKGCPRCRNTGYFGRVAILEVLPYAESLKKLTTAKTNSEILREKALSEGLITLRQNAIQKMLNGETTYQEVLRVTTFES
jgi:general secretion pathway protein E